MIGMEIYEKVNIENDLRSLKIELRNLCLKYPDNDEIKLLLEECLKVPLNKEKTDNEYFILDKWIGKVKKYIMKNFKQSDLVVYWFENDVPVEMVE
jgi:hypothetical protein